MGQEILYCYKCQTRLLGSEFDKGKAFKVGDKAACAVCVKHLLGSIPPPPPKPEAPLRISSSNRIPVALTDPSTKAKREAEKSKTGLIIGLVLGGIALVILVAMAMKSGSGPTARRDPDPPTPPLQRPSDPSPVPPPTSGFAGELREIDEKMRTALANDEFRTVVDLLADARRRRSTPEWLNEIDLRSPQVEARARRSSIPLREKGLEAQKRNDEAEVKRLRERIAAWGFPGIVDEFDKALAAPVPPPTPPPAPAPVDPLPADARLVYADALGPACRSASWGGIVDFAATAQVFDGKHAIAFTPQQVAAGVYIALDQTIDLAEYPFVTFALYLPEHTGVGVAIYQDWKPSGPIGLEKLGGYPNPGEWKKYVLPVASLNSGTSKVTGLVVQVFQAGTKPMLYIDNVAFLKGASEGKAPPPTPPLTTAEPPLVVYDDALAPGWKNWSWSSVVDFACTTPVFEGEKSIAFTPQQPSAGLYLHFEAGLDPAKYPFVTFAAYVADEQVYAYASIYKDKKVAGQAGLAELIPDFKVREWKRYVVPVSRLNGSPTGMITGFQIQSVKTGSQPLIYVDSIAFLRGMPSKSPSAGSDVTRSRWSPAAAKAVLRDYAGAQREIEESLASLKEDAAKAEAAADLELLKLAGQVPVEAAKAIERWTRGTKVKLELLNIAGGRDLVEGSVVAVDAVRLTVQRESGLVDLPIAEIAASSLAEIFRARADRKPTDARAAAAFCLFEGDAEAARKLLGDGAPLPEKAVALSKERPAAEAAARRQFWTAESEFLTPRRRSAAIEHFTSFLAGEPAAYVARLRPFVAARLESAKDTVFLADDLNGGGTFAQTSGSKLDVTWASTADSAPGKARENFVEAEFHAFPGAPYKAWIWAGACCLETFEFLLQGSEMTSPNSKNSKEPFSCEPGADNALTAKLPSTSLKKWHAQHGGPKEPARWEWIPVALPKYETAGPRKLRVLTSQQGFSVGAIVVSATRRETPKEAEMKELEKTRFGIRKSANTGPLGYIVQEIWENIDGETVESLVKSPAFAGKPTNTSVRELFEGAVKYADRYGSRIRGYVHPPVTGAYIFWISCDDHGEVSLSTDDTPVRKRVVCSLAGASGYRDWTRLPTSKSAPVMLTAGKRYYIEALHKEGGGDDHLSVGWTLPDGTDERPIPGSRLSPFNAPPPPPGPSGAVFFRGYNVNGPSTIIDGRRWEGRGSKELAFSQDGAFENQSVPLNPPTDEAKAAMIRTSAFSPNGTAVKIYQLPAGAYQVYLYVWEDNNDQVYDLLLQEKVVVKGHHSGTAGHWDKLGPFPVTLPDAGMLDFKTIGGDANVSGVEIWKVGR
jgi:hypothetical protein